MSGKIIVSIATKDMSGGYHSTEKEFDSERAYNAYIEAIHTSTRKLIGIHYTAMKLEKFRWDKYLSLHPEFIPWDLSVRAISIAIREKRSDSFIEAIRINDLKTAKTLLLNAKN